MTGSQTQAEILLRKRHTSPVTAGPAQDSDELAMAKAFVRAGHETLGMRVQVLSATARTETGIEQLTPVFADHALCLAGRGSDGETGVIALSLDLVTAVIEKSSTGEVGNRPVMDRAGTSIDALFAEPLLRAMLKNLSLSCAPELRQWASTAELSKKPSNTDDLEFEIAEGAHRVVMLHLKIDGTREGELVALIPQPSEPGGSHGGQTGKEGKPSDPAAGMRQRLLGSRTTLRADLISFDVPLAEFRNWMLGSAIKIPGDAIGAISLTQNGDTDIAHGRLGQANGHQAVRLDLAQKPLSSQPLQDEGQDAPLLADGSEPAGDGSAPTEPPVLPDDEAPPSDTEDA